MVMAATEAPDQGLHLHSGAVLGAGHALDVYARLLLDDREGQVHLGQRKRMAERHQFRGALGRHDAGHLGHRQHVALGQSLLLSRRRVSGAIHTRAPTRATRPWRCLAAHVDHPGLAALVDVGQTGLVHLSPPTCDMPRAVRPGRRFLSKVLHSSDSADRGQHAPPVPGLHGRA